jgi:hypothetical protein
MAATGISIDITDTPAEDHAGGAPEPNEHQPPVTLPRGQQPVSESRIRCRVPGCPSKKSGPRYDLFCRDHYAQLNAEERAKMKAMWKSAQPSVGRASNGSAKSES